MTALVVGATGATGRHLVKHLLDRGQTVRAIVRSADKLPGGIRDHDGLHVIQASLLDLSDAELVEHVADCSAVASCLGHNLTLKGIYGHPRRLVTDATRRLCQAVSGNQLDGASKFVLMNTTGNTNRDLDEPQSARHRIALGALRILLPPQRDNEAAADYLRTEIGQVDSEIEWVVVRPDSLIDHNTVSEYETFVSPMRDPLFDPGRTSRINVAHFMAELITDDDLWSRWRGQMPVIYDAEPGQQGDEGT